MKAVLVNAYGGPEALEIAEVPEPHPGPGQVTIQVDHAGVNFAEVTARRGGLPALAPPFTPGLEVAGRVREVGPDVAGLQPGDHVAAFTSTGGYAEVALAKADLTYRLNGLADAVAPAVLGALPTIVPTAYALVAEVGRLRAGEDILIQSAAGGIGTVAGQVARALGAGRVLGVVRQSSKADYARDFGYDDVFVRDGFVEAARGATDGRGVDVLLESVGGPTRTESLELLAPLGRMVIFGNSSAGAEDTPVGGQLRATNRGILGFGITALAAADPQRLISFARKAFDLVADGKVRVDVREELPLEQAAEAHRLLESGETQGKLVLRIAGA